MSEDFKNGDVVKYSDPLPDEVDTRYILLENPEGGRALAEAVVNTAIKPTYILSVEDIEKE